MTSVGQTQAAFTSAQSRSTPKAARTSAVNASRDRRVIRYRARMTDPAPRFGGLLDRARSSRLLRGVGELVLLGAALLVFTLLHAAMTTDVSVPTANALSLQAWEKTLHLDVELAANRWLTDHPALVLPAVYYYRLYYLALVGVLVWTYFRHTEVYRKGRRALLVMVALVLPVYWAVPMSPPRFSLPGVVDVVALHSPIGNHAPQASGGQVLYSAMPSMHTAWSLWCAYVAWSALRTSHPRLAPLPWLFPLGMVATVLTTGNHYVLDLVGSAVLVTASVAAASALHHRL